MARPLMSKVRKDGRMTIPARVRRDLGLERDDGVALHPNGRGGYEVRRIPGAFPSKARRP